MDGPSHCSQLQSSDPAPPPKALTERRGVGLEGGGVVVVGGGGGGGGMRFEGEEARGVKSTGNSDCWRLEQQLPGPSGAPSLCPATMPTP